MATPRGSRPSLSETWGGVLVLCVIAVMLIVVGSLIGGVLAVPFYLLGLFAFTGSVVVVLKRLGVLDDTLRVWKVLAIPKFLGRAWTAWRANSDELGNQ